jgi:hypothetical protein
MRTQAGVLNGRYLHSVGSVTLAIIAIALGRDSPAVRTRLTQIFTDRVMAHRAASAAQVRRGGVAMARVGWLVALGITLASGPAAAADVFFSTGSPDGLMAALSGPGAGGATETADDFVLGATTTITGASFTGLLTGQATVTGVTVVGVEVYRIFPLDSDVGATSGAPVFSTAQVPTRVNSPSDVAFDSRQSDAALTYTAATLAPTFTASNSIVTGINPKPNQTTGGEGAVSGTEALFSVDFSTPLVLSAGHYFFVPQVAVTGGNFLWLSAPQPISGSGTTPFSPDLQAWIRDGDLAPDWLRVGTDVVGSSAFNMSFSLTGAAAPEPATWGLMLLGIGGLGAIARRRRAAGVLN